LGGEAGRGAARKRGRIRRSTIVEVTNDSRPARCLLSPWGEAGGGVRARQCPRSVFRTSRLPSPWRCAPVPLPAGRGGGGIRPPIGGETPSAARSRALPLGFRAALTPGTPSRHLPSDRQPDHKANPNIYRNNTSRTTLKPTSQVRSKLLIPLVNFPEFLVDSLITRD
jgi:hypothetical protein